MTAIIVLLIVPLIVFLVFLIQKFIMNGPITFYEKEIGCTFIVLETSQEDETVTLLMNGERKQYLLPEGEQMPTVGIPYQLLYQNGMYCLREVPKPVLKRLQNAA